MYGPPGERGVFSPESADKLWPPSTALKGYRRVRDLYNAGKFDDGFRLLSGLVSQTLVLAPKSGSWTRSDHYYTAYMTSRIMPTDSMLRNVWRINSEHATELLKQGKPDEALGILAVNLQLSKAIVHTSPRVVICLIQGNGLWKSTWNSIAKALSQQKRQAEANAANRYSRVSLEFSQLWIGPIVDEQSAESDRLTKKLDKVPENKQDQYARPDIDALIKKELAAANDLVKQWDKEVYTPEASKLLKKLLR